MKWERLLINDKIIFIHIPKTGGSSVKKYFFGKDIIYHKTLTELHHINPNIPEKYQIFSVVRNPYNRVKSIYRHVTKQKNRCKPYGINETISFEDFIKDGHFKKSTPNNFSLPQTDYLSLNGVLYYTHIIKFENIQKEIVNFTKINNITSVMSSFPHLRKWKEKKGVKRKINLTDELKEIVYEYYKDDFINFNYLK